MSKETIFRIDHLNKKVYFVSNKIDILLKINELCKNENQMTKNECKGYCIDYENKTLLNILYRLSLAD